MLNFSEIFIYTNKTKNKPKHHIFIQAAKPICGSFMEGEDANWLRGLPKTQKKYTVILNIFMF